MIAGILMDIACDLARGRVCCALRLEWTFAAVAPRCTIAHLVVAADVAGDRRTACWWDRRRRYARGRTSSRCLRRFHHRDRAYPSRECAAWDTGADEPAEELADPIIPCRQPAVLASKPLRLFGTLDHGFGRGHFVVAAGRSCLHVDDNRVLDVDQIIEPVAE